jgi:hypothetical protein
MRYLAGVFERSQANRRGSLVHADETKGVVYGGGHYVWIFANLTSVAYVYSASREASILDDVLAEFKGVWSAIFMADTTRCLASSRGA